MELLALSEDGAFIVRDSSSQPGNFALTMRGFMLMHHFIIRQTKSGGLVLGTEAEGQPAFPNLTALIIYYSKNKGKKFLNTSSFRLAHAVAIPSMSHSNTSVRFGSGSRQQTLH